MTHLPGSRKAKPCGEVAVAIIDRERLLAGEDKLSTKASELLMKRWFEHTMKPIALAPIHRGHCVAQKLTL